MKLVQKVLSHGLLIGFFVASFFTYLYRAELFPQWFGNTPQSASLPAQSKTVEQTALQGRPAAPAHAAVPADTAPVTAGRAADAADLPPMAPPGGDAPTSGGGGAQDAVSDLPPLAGVSDADQTPPAQIAAASDTAPLSDPAAEPAWDNAPAPRFRPLEAEPDAASVQADAVDATPPPAMALQQDAAPVPDNMPLAAAPMVVQPDIAAVASAPQAEAVPPASAPPGSASPVVAAPAAGADAFQEQLEMARSHFWRRDVRGALQAYQQLTTAWPAQADAWGELGNLYLRIGNRQAAAEAYYRTISILLDQGDPDRAHSLLEVLYGLDSGRASELEKRFRQVSS